MSEDPFVYETGMPAYSYADVNPVSHTDPLGLCAMSPDMYYCLMHIFKQDPDQVKIVEKPDPESKWSAITRKNKITIYVSCDDFFSDYLVVLEEYYHVFEQWNKKKMFGLRYGFKWLFHGYEGHPYEDEAKLFALIHEEELRQCIECQWFAPEYTQIHSNVGQEFCIVAPANQNGSFCYSVLKFYFAILIVFTLTGCLPKEGGFRVVGKIPEAGKVCKLQSFLAKTDEPFKSRLVAHEFNIFFGTSPERHEYYFVVNCDGLCYQSQPYLLGHMERVDLGALELTECKKVTSISHSE